MDCASVGDGRDPVLFQVERMGMRRLQRRTEVRERDAGCVFVCAVKSNTFDSLAVNETTHEHHHYCE